MIQGGQSLESLEDFKRKLDNEHTTVSAKLDQGARARQELQELKSKLVEDLEVSNIHTIGTQPILISYLYLHSKVGRH